MPVRTHTFNGVRYSIDICDVPVDGYCDYPRGEMPGIHIIDVGDRKGLENIIHESLHAENWAKSEVVVTRTAKEIATLLWRLGYRRKMKG